MNPGYFRYFVPSRGAETWGIEVTACGHLATRPAAAYPPPGHPADHLFEWRKGRTLEALQIVLICAGGGRLEFRKGATRSIEAGAAFVLPPGVWHRYRPDEGTGWEESWIEVRGPIVDRVMKLDGFARRRLVKPRAAAGGLDQALHRVHQLAAAAGPTFSAELAAAGMAVLANWVSAPAGAEGSVLDQAVLAAEREIAERHAEPLDIEALARRLGVAYSHLRRAFKARTGLSPWQYVLRVRLTRARRLLAMGHSTLKEIAGEVGFGSAFHLSSAFKKAYGQSPDQWRRDLSRASPRRRARLRP